MAFSAFDGLNPTEFSYRFKYYEAWRDRAKGALNSTRAPLRWLCVIVDLPTAERVLPVAYSMVRDVANSAIYVLHVRDDSWLACPENVPWQQMRPQLRDEAPIAELIRTLIDAWNVRLLLFRSIDVPLNAIGEMVREIEPDVVIVAGSNIAHHSHRWARIVRHSRTLATQLSRTNFGCQVVVIR